MLRLLDDDCFRQTCPRRQIKNRFDRNTLGGNLCCFRRHQQAITIIFLMFWKTICVGVNVQDLYYCINSTIFFHSSTDRDGSDSWLQCFRLEKAKAYLLFTPDNISGINEQSGIHNLLRIGTVNDSHLLIGPPTTTSSALLTVLGPPRGSKQGRLI